MTAPKAESLRGRLMDWYRRHRRALPWRRSRDPYRIWVSEVMLQQTRVETAEPYWHRFLAQFPDIHSLARADQQTVLKCWEGLGYYARARNLHRAARQVVDQHGGRVPDRLETFRRLPGVGDYIAAAVLSIAFNQPLAAVDGNVRRVLARLYRIDSPAGSGLAARSFARAAGDLLARSDPGTFNQALMELGALICRPRNPACNRCPLQAGCRCRAEGCVADFPRRPPARKLPAHRLASGVVQDDGRLLIVRRPPHGLLGGLWEFPAGERLGRETAGQTCLRMMREQTGLAVALERPLARIRHAYTHFRIEMDGFLCRRAGGRVKLQGPVEHRWVTTAALADYPLHKANHKLLPHLLGAL